jgi:hypothetical protein
LEVGIIEALAARVALASRKKRSLLVVHIQASRKTAGQALLHHGSQ